MNIAITSITTIPHTIDSREVAELIGKQHAHVMRDIRALLDQGVDQSNFGLVDYADAKGERRPCYQLTKKGCLILASGYNAKLREAIINRWEELEAAQQSHVALPQNFAQALRLAAEQVELIEQQRQQLATQQQEVKQLTAENEKLRKDSDYLNVILQSKKTVAITQIAQDYGMSAVKFNAILHDMHIQRKVNKQWILYAHFLEKGYVHSEVVPITRSDGQPDIVSNTKWTQRGRIFLYEELKKKDILPLIER